MPLRISFKTSPQRVDWATLDATWMLAGQLGGFDGAWMNDHLTDMDEANPGPSLEALTLLATLVHHVPGVRVGHGVLANTFRHPVLVAKAATVLDHATGGGGRFVLGLGAGWFEGEHEPFGIPLPPIGERIDRLISAVEVLRLLFSPEAAAAPGVTRPDPFYPLAGAVNAPAPLTPGGPPIFLGGQKPRGIALAARRAAGWLVTGTEAGDVPYFTGRREAILDALEAEGRDPAGFEIVAQVHTGPDAASRARALDQARALVAAGATEMIVGVPAGLGPRALEDAHREVALPLRDATG
ncbi:MAG: LLM class flavin-dependent oxidoreductase [Chloroflexota bacterium]|nr:LLM class flavin-dependent oxidoreductase [Chloroflexota bacterium]